MSRSAGRFLLQLIPEASLGSSACGVTGSARVCAVVCSVRQKVVAGVWLFSGAVYTWERGVQ